MGVWIETFLVPKELFSWNVTPCVGVWIETCLQRQFPGSLSSHPAWVCGLKLSEAEEAGFARPVTPCVGVWIETFCRRLYNIPIRVTPCVGVWIETTQ